MPFEICHPHGIMEWWNSGILILKGSYPFFIFIKLSVKRYFAMNPMTHFFMTHYSIIPLFHYSNWGEAPSSLWFMLRTSNCPRTYMSRWCCRPWWAEAGTKGDPHCGRPWSRRVFASRGVPGQWPGGNCPVSHHPHNWFSARFGVRSWRGLPWKRSLDWIRRFLRVSGVPF